MRPAWSVIFFTSVSGVGYGLAFWLGLGVFVGLVEDGGVVPMVALGLSLLFISVGLLSSTLHLHHPERAWRALSQWRSSWLSREGVCAIAAYIPLVWFGFTLWQGEAHPIAALLVMVTSLVTVFCTAMIYASLRPVRAWSHRLVPGVYLGFALASGAYWLLLMWAPTMGAPMWLPIVVIVALGAVWLVKLVYWRDVDRTRSGSSPATATGLSGQVLPLDPPHTEENYLLHEMAYTVARRHVQKLRPMAVVLGFVLPLLCLIGLFVPTLASWFLLGVGAAGLTAGILVERWLFFAEATHTVGLYYGAAEA